MSLERGAATGATVFSLPPSRSDDAVLALADAFHDYPVMRYVIGDAGEDYDRRLALMIGFHVGGRVLKGHRILSIEDGGRAVAVATITPAGEQNDLRDFPERREAVWRELGAEAKERSEGLVRVWERLAVPGSHVHLNMLGVRRSLAHRGLGRLLLDQVHEMSRRDPRSKGVSLSTEDARNVPLYQHCGYQITNHERVTDDLETWIFFRPNDTSDRKETKP